MKCYDEEKIAFYWDLNNQTLRCFGQKANDQVYLVQNIAISSECAITYRMFRAVNNIVIVFQKFELIVSIP